MYRYKRLISTKMFCCYDTYKTVTGLERHKQSAKHIAEVRFLGAKIQREMREGYTWCPDCNDSYATRLFNKHTNTKRHKLNAYKFEVYAQNPNICVENSRKIHMFKFDYTRPIDVLPAAPIVEVIEVVEAFEVVEDVEVIEADVEEIAEVIEAVEVEDEVAEPPTMAEVITKPIVRLVASSIIDKDFIEKVIAHVTSKSDTSIIEELFTNELSRPIAMSMAKSMGEHVPALTANCKFMKEASMLLEAIVSNIACAITMPDFYTDIQQLISSGADMTAAIKLADEIAGNDTSDMIEDFIKHNYELAFPEITTEPIIEIEEVVEIAEPIIEIEEVVEVTMCEPIAYETYTLNEYDPESSKCTLKMCCRPSARATGGTYFSKYDFQPVRKGGVPRNEWDDDKLDRYNKHMAQRAHRVWLKEDKAYAAGCIDREREEVRTYLAAEKLRFEVMDKVSKDESKKEEKKQASGNTSEENDDEPDIGNMGLNDVISALKHTEPEGVKTDTLTLTIDSILEEEGKQKDDKKPTHIRLRNYAIGALITYPVKRVIPLLKQIQRLLPFVTNNDNTIQVYHKIRNEVKTTHGLDSPEYQSIVEYTKLPAEVYDAIRAEYRTEVKKANENRTVMPAAKITHVLDSLKFMPVDIYILLQLTAGTRIGELMNVSTFEAMPDNTHIKQVGIEKRKDKNSSIIKPVLFVEAKEWVSLLDTARSANPQPSLTHINKRIKELFGEKLSSHDMRRLYVSIGYQLLPDSKREKMSEAAYLNEVLGHEPLALDVGTIYSTIHVQANPLKKTKFTFRIVKKQVPRNGLYTSLDENLHATINALKFNREKITQKLIASYGYSPTSVRNFTDRTGMKF